MIPGLRRCASENAVGMLCAAARRNSVFLMKIESAEVGITVADGFFQHAFRKLAQDRQVELEITWSTSEVAVCCSRASVRSVVRWRSSLSSRAFSMAMTAWAAKFLTKLDLFLGEGADFLTVDYNGAN